MLLHGGSERLSRFGVGAFLLCLQLVGFNVSWFANLTGQYAQDSGVSNYVDSTAL